MTGAPIGAGQPLRDRPLFLNFFEQPPSTLDAPSFMAGRHARLASVRSDQSAFTAIVDVGAGSRAEHLGDGALELFVLAGEIRVSGRTLRSGGYCASPDGSVFRFESGPGARLCVMWARDGVVRERCISVWEEPWDGPGITLRLAAGPEPGPGRFMEAVNGCLWLGFVRPGWISADMEVHDAWEENLLLRGDLFMPQEGRGVMTAGTQLSNPSGHWHGPMASKGGALFLIQTDRPRHVELRPYTPGRDLLLEYLESAPW